MGFGRSRKRWNRLRNEKPEQTDVDFRMKRMRRCFAESATSSKDHTKHMLDLLDVRHQRRVGWSTSVCRIDCDNGDMQIAAWYVGELLLWQLKAVCVVFSRVEMSEFNGCWSRPRRQSIQPPSPGWRDLLSLPPPLCALTTTPRRAAKQKSPNLKSTHSNTVSPLDVSKLC